jgi:hypothetical protein
MAACRRTGHRQGCSIAQTAPAIKAIKKPLEEIIDPKPLFLALLSQADLPADDRVYEEIASAADLNRIAERCPRFAEFHKYVHAC